MDDFEYSVEISDRDWQCFFMECEECNLLPPSLAGVDDSGMSDLDDTASMLAKRVQKIDLTAGFSEADHPIDGPPDSVGPPVDHYLSKYAASGMESVLSGSEEDMDLQSVNMFFERLKNLTEAERPAEPSQVTAGKNREATEEEHQCSDGQQASSSTLPKNTPKLNSLPARGETPVGKETMKPVDAISNINTMQKVKPGFNISLEPAASNSAIKTNRLTYPEAELFIREEACTESRVKSQFHDSPERVFCTETTPSTDKVIKVDMRTPLDGVKQEDLSTSQLTLSKKCSTDLLNNLEMLTSLNALQPDAPSTNKTASQESSPSASIKRKRRKKRRLSVEPVESGLGCERHRTEDSEEEQCTWRGGAGFCLSEDINLPQKNDMSSLYSITSNPPARISTKKTEVNYLSRSDPPCDNQYQYLPETIVRQGRCKATGLAEIHSTNDSQSVTPLSQTDDSVRKALNISSNVVTHLQPCMKLQVEELTGLNKYCWLPRSVAASVTVIPDTPGGTGNSDTNDSHAESLQPSYKVNHLKVGCENEQNLKCSTAEVKSITHSILPRADSNDPDVEVSQNDKLSVAKSVLAVEGGYSGRYNDTLCQRETEQQQQLEIDTDQYSSTPGKTHFPLSETGRISADAHNIKLQQFKTRACPFSDDISCKVSSFKLADSCTNSTSDKSCLSVKQTERPMEIQNLSKSDILSEKTTTAEAGQLEPSQIMNLCPSDETNLTSSRQRETKLPMSEDLLTSPSDITPLSSCCTLDTESVMSLSNENITDVSASFCSSISQNESEGQGERKSLILEKHVEKDATIGPESQSVMNNSAESKCDLASGAEDAITLLEAECEPKKALDSNQSVFTMSSFWSEMEKLTINDILGLRMADKAAPHSSLPPLQENEETDMFDTNDSGVFTQLDESKLEQTPEYMLSIPDSVQLSLSSVMALDSSSSTSVTWESEPVPVSAGADIYPENMMLTSASGISQPIFSGSAQKCLRNISKNVSVHNLHSLESEPFSSTLKHQTLPALDERGLEKVQYFTDKHVSRKDNEMDSSPSSLTDSYRTSIVDIFQYFFVGKQSIPSPSPTDDLTTFSTDGNSLPETYDHFFSDFDTESFFCPLFTAEEQAKDELVHIFSYSRSANKKLQFPEAYDYFFASSSSDNSSVESDDEENSGPVRVVTRFNQKASTSQISVDAYENFFTDKDLRQNFFWKDTLSFRNFNLTGSTVEKQALSNSMSLVPVRQNDISLRRTVYPSNVLGNQDVVFPDPLLSHLEDRISRQLAQQPFRYGDLQTAVSNPSKSHFTQWCIIEDKNWVFTSAVIVTVD